MGRSPTVSDPARPLYLIGVVADMLGIHPQTLRLWERKGLIRPNRTEGRTRMYSADDVEDIRRIIRLTRDLGVNLAGVDIILRMRRQMLSMQKDMETLSAHVPQPVPGRREGRADSPGLVPVADRRLQKLHLL
jgi:MerR family transcriptional regulator/heat shock protein HspR